MTYIQNLQVPFHKRYEYKIITIDVVQLENLSKQIVLKFIFPDNTFNTFKFDDTENTYDMAGSHSQHKIYDVVKYKNNHGPGNNYCYSIGFTETFGNFADLYKYVCSESYTSIYGIFFESEVDEKTIKLVNKYISQGWITKTFLNTDEYIDWRKIINQLKTHALIGTRFGTGFNSYEEYPYIVVNYNLTSEESGVSVEHILTGFRNFPELKSHLVKLYLEFADKPINQKSGLVTQVWTNSYC